MIVPKVISWRKSVLKSVVTPRTPKLQLCVIYHEKPCIQRLLAYSQGRANLLFLAQKSDKCDTADICFQIIRYDLNFQQPKLPWLPWLQRSYCIDQPL